MHRVAAENVFAVEPLPAFRASIKDGYAVIGMYAFRIRRKMHSNNVSSVYISDLLVICLWRKFYGKRMAGKMKLLWGFGEDV